MPTKSNNTGGQGGARPGSGRKKKAVASAVTTAPVPATPEPEVIPPDIVPEPEKEGGEEA